ncbi:MAG: hypothetical protein ACLS28_18245 [Clostridium neonatale]
MSHEIIITNKETMYYPVVEEGITWETERKGSPGKVTFKIYKDSVLNIEEGNSVSIRKMGKMFSLVLYSLLKLIKKDFIILLLMIN